MLAQSFKTAEELKLTEPQLDALRKTLVLLETGKLVHVPIDPNGNHSAFDSPFTGHFNMSLVEATQDCGTVCCIKGTAQLVGMVDIHETTDGLCSLFYPDDGKGEWGAITPAQAARALRSYLTTGEPNWEEALRV